MVYAFDLNNSVIGYGVQCINSTEKEKDRTTYFSMT